MAERWVWWDEQYPVYGLSETPTTEGCKLSWSEEELARYEAVKREYEAWQERIAREVGR